MKEDNIEIRHDNCNNQMATIKRKTMMINETKKKRREKEKKIFFLFTVFFSLSTGTHTHICHLIVMSFLSISID
jgi:hypothetical protein